MKVRVNNRKNIWFIVNEIFKLSVQDQNKSEGLIKLKEQYGVKEDILERFEDKVLKLNKVMIYYQVL